jgi:V/A-type H+-transporting ATPase subunit D
MAQAKINATRMELLKQKKRLKVAERGHKLLKDKRDELMRRFLELVEESRGLREKVEEKLIEGFKSFLVARAEMSREVMAEALMSGAEGELKLEMESVMSVWVPRFEFALNKEVAYGFASTSAELDRSLAIFEEVLSELIKLAEIEKSLELLAGEIETTRRRVNVLEQILIPQIETYIKTIEMTLDEMERSTKAQLLRIKDILGVS